MLGAAPLAEEVVAPVPAGPERKCSVAVLVTAARLAIGVEGLIDALNTARGAPWCSGNAGWAKLVPPVGGALVVRCEVLRAQGHAALLHGTACTDHSGPSFVRPQGPDLPVRGAFSGADVATLLVVGNVWGPGGVGVGPPAVLSRRAAAGGGVVNRVEDCRRLPFAYSGVGNRVSQCFHRRLGLLLLLGLRWLLLRPPQRGVVGGARGSRRLGLAGVDLRGRSVGLSLLPEGRLRLLLRDDPGCYDVRLPRELHLFELGEVLGLGGLFGLCGRGSSLGLSELHRLCFGGYPMNFGSGLECGEVLSVCGLSCLLRHDGKVGLGDAFRLLISGHSLGLGDLLGPGVGRLVLLQSFGSRTLLGFLSRTLASVNNEGGHFILVGLLLAELPIFITASAGEVGVGFHPGRGGVVDYLSGHLECSGLRLVDRLGAGQVVLCVTKGCGPRLAGGPVSRRLHSMGLLYLVEAKGRGCIIAQGLLQGRFLSGSELAGSELVLEGVQPGLLGSRNGARVGFDRR